jgi:hypothetical protein
MFLIIQYVLSREFYFSDGNLVKDNYLKSLMDEGGFVKLGQISHFHRIKDCPPYQVSGNGFL